MAEVLAALWLPVFIGSSLLVVLIMLSYALVNAFISLASMMWALRDD